MINQPGFVFPRVLIACVATMLKMMLTNMTTTPLTVIALILEGREYLFEGIVNGEITEERSGAEGFGYDPVFRPDGYAETFAEMPLELKNSISHRGRATAKLIEFLSAL